MRIVLISDDSDFFEYISPKLMLRKSDELFKFSFDSIPEKLHLLKSAVMIINSENSEDRTLELLNLSKGTPSIIFAYNEDENFRINVYKNGALGYATPLTSDEEIQAKMIPALAIAGMLEKSDRYREVLVKTKLVTPNNEVFLDYNTLLDEELARIDAMSIPAVLLAISPDEKTKFLLQPNQIETILLNNIRKNDILMNYAANKYFLLLYNTDPDSAQKLWEKICKNIPQKIYAGIANTVGKKRQQVVNEVLNKLHRAINYEKSISGAEDKIFNNFKQYRIDFDKKMNQIVTPVFYQIKQKYSNKLFGMNINNESKEGYNLFSIQCRNCIGNFKITSPGCSKINIDISLTKTPAKRVTLEPEELEAGLLEDLLEQFIEEFKREVGNDNS